MNDTDKWLVIVNPQAYMGNAKKDWPKIEKALIENGFDFDAFLTEHIHHAVDLVRDKITECGYKRIIAVGGDGTFNEVSNGIFLQQRFSTTDITLGLIPVGTGNDWTRTYEFPKDYDKVIKIIKAGQTFRQDVGKVTYHNNGDPKVRYFVNEAGTGLDEMVCKQANILKQKGKGGKMNYLFSLVKCLMKYKCTHVQIELDGELVFDDSILSMTVGICRFNGGGMMMMPNAIPDDGLFDITVIKKVGLLKFALNAKRIYDGSFIKKLHEVSTFRGKKIHIISIPSHSLLLETEGENLTDSPFDFEILPQAINILVKPSAARKLMIDKNDNSKKNK